MVKPPQVCGLILCREMTVDMVQRNVALDGLFLVLHVARFPSPVQFTVYTALFGGRGEGEMSLTCMHLETEADIYYHKRWLGFPDAGRTVHYEVPIRQMILPRPGRYAFTLAFNNTALTVRYLDIMRS
jgi:hypothetical protein